MSTADLIVMADRVHTMTASRPVTAIAIADGVVTGLGERSGAREWRGPGTEVIELGAATVTPGLVDGHAHPVLGIGMTRGADLSGVRTLDELGAVLSSVRHEGWLEGWGLDPNVFGDRPLTSAPLPVDVPVFLLLFDAHSALVNQRALDLAGITGPREFPSGASIVCDAGGRPTGHLLEMDALTLVRDLLPADEPAARRRRLLGLMRQMAASGLTAANAMDFEDDSLELFRALEADGDLPMRWRCAPFVMPDTDVGEVLEKQRLHGRRWRVEGAKFMIDGTVDGGTAWLEEPDAHGESTACLWPDPAGYAAAVRVLAARGVPIVTHAIGDAGIRYVLDTLAELPRVSSVPHRVEHLETMPSGLVGRFRQLDVTASMQPTHCTHYTRADHSDNWSRRLGKVRADRGFRARDLRDSGARLALGSDWPIAPYDPRGIIAAARLRRPAGRPEVDPVLPGQALTARMALEGYTTQAAGAAGLGDRAGRLAPGYRADLTAFALDPLTADPDEFAESPVVLTVVAGSVVHRT
ncbi:amidohydrolase [Paractinoplanes deccanensis]|uniref:Amidohydrolase n=1 Tax=Paractinoplanes deccanensis TaxID=113561 RepID=A0ABQ3XYY3_9ACTN|nr:amidohydrolase [Actinoplanes deccanensis]GID72947.1 amidohydrolase [Actinoplanes deccanensis]